MRSIFFYFLILIKLLLSCYAQELDITSPQGFYQGSPEAIKGFVQKCEAQLKQALSCLNLIQKEKLSKEEKKDFLEALDFLENLSFQLIRLKKEIKTPEYTIASLPETGSAPYKLEEFGRYISLYHQITKKLDEYQKQLRIISANLSDIKEQLKQIVIQYMELKKDSAKKIKTYALFAQLRSLQVEYALKMLKKKKLDNAIKKLTSLAEKCKRKIADIFNNLDIDVRDIKSLIVQQKELARQKDSLRREILSQQRLFNKRITLFELRLDSIINKLTSAQVSEVGKRLLEEEKRRIEAYLNRFQYQKEILNQKVIYLDLNKSLIDFRYDWISNYARYPGYKKTEIIIRKWKKRLDDIETKIDQLKEKLVQMRFDLSILNERILRISKEIDTETDQQVKDSLKMLENELRKNKEYLNRLIDQLSKNLIYARNIIWNIKNVLFLMQNRISSFEIISYKVKTNAQDIWLRIKGVIYYPLWSIGGNVITTVTILKIVFFLCLGIYLLRLLKKRLSKFLIEKFGLSVGLVNSISTLSYYFMLILVIFIALSTAGVNLSQITIILGALGVGIGFGLQTIANNFISGLILLTERTIKVGDIVELENGLTGIVKDVSIRSTVIRTYDGMDIVVPNSDFISNKVTTWTYGDDWRRLRIPFVVSYGSDPDKVAEIAKEVARQIPTTIEDADHPISVWFEGFGESSLNFSLLVWCRMRELKPVTGLISDYYFALFRRFKEEGIEIPFPQRDLHIRSVSSSIIESLKKKGEEDERV